MSQPTTDPAAGAADISMREWICWDAESPTEPTSTLVLTTPASTFLDIRLLLPAPITSPTACPPPNAGGLPTRLDWAFSGTSESLPPLDISEAEYDSACAPLLPIDVSGFSIPTPQGKRLMVPRKRWNHVIDSRCAWGQTPQADEGAMYPVLGRPEACLEIGKMERVPGSGSVSAYQELWVSVDAKQVGSESGRRRGLVLSLSQPDRKARGIVVRVAQYCQALLLVDGHIELERWEHCVDAQGSGDGWRRIAKVGSKVLPCPWTFEGGKAENAKVGDTLVNGDMEWKIEEKFRW